MFISTTKVSAVATAAVALGFGCGSSTHVQLPHIVCVHALRLQMQNTDTGEAMNVDPPIELDDSSILAVVDAIAEEAKMPKSFSQAMADEAGLPKESKKVTSAFDRLKRVVMNSWQKNRAHVVDAIVRELFRRVDAKFADVSDPLSREPTCIEMMFAGKCPMRIPAKRAGAPPQQVTASKVSGDAVETVAPNKKRSFSFTMKPASFNLEAAREATFNSTQAEMMSKLQDIQLDGGARKRIRSDNKENGDSRNAAPFRLSKPTFTV